MDRKRPLEPYMALSEGKSRKLIKKSIKCRHESARNTYRFESFRSRMDSLSFDVLQTSLKKQVASEKDVQSYTKECLYHWEDLNISQVFTDFKKKVRIKVDSVAQILHEKKYIFDSLKVSIELKDIHSLEPLLDVLGQFARDLVGEFEEFLIPSLELLVGLLSLKESTNWVFTTLCYILKYCKKKAVKQLMQIYNAFLPILDSSYEYIIRFTAEVLSFIVRSCDHDSIYEFLEKVVEDLSNKSYNLISGIGLVLAESIEGPFNQPHEISKFLITEYLRKTNSKPAIMAFKVFFELCLSKKNPDVYSRILLDCFFQTTNCIPVVVKCELLYIFAKSTVRPNDLFNFALEILIESMDIESNLKLIVSIALLYKNCQEPNVALEKLLMNSLDHQPICKQSKILKTTLLYYFLSKNNVVLSKQQIDQITSLQEIPSQETIENVFFLLNEIDWIQKPKVTIPSFYKYAQAIIRQLICTVREGETNFREQLNTVFMTAFIMKNDLDAGCEFRGQIMELYSVTGKISDKSEMSTIISIISFLAPACFQDEDFLQFTSNTTFTSNINFLVCLDSLSKKKWLDQVSLSNIASNLANHGDKRRKVSFKVLYDYFSDVSDPILHICKDLNEMHFRPENMREASLKLRSIGLHFDSCTSEEIQHIVVYHCFGLLLENASTLWKFVASALKNILESKPNLEDVIFDLSFNWLYDEHIWQEDEPDMYLDLKSYRKSDHEQICTFFQQISLNFNKYVYNRIQSQNSSNSNRNRVSQRTQSLIVLSEIAPLLTKSRKRLLGLACNVLEAQFNRRLFEKNQIIQRNGNWIEKDIELLVSSILKIEKLNKTNSTLSQNSLNTLLIPNINIQKHIICILIKMSPEAYKKHGDNLLTLLDSKKYRDVITCLVQNESEYKFEHQNEPLSNEAVDIFARILFSIAISKKNSSSKSLGQAQRRKIICTAIAQLDERFSRKFFEFITMVFSNQTLFTLDETENLEICESNYFSPDAKVLGFLNLCQAYIEAIGSKLIRHETDVSLYLLYCMMRCTKILEYDRSEVRIKQAKAIKAGCFKALVTIMEIQGSKLATNNTIVKKIFEYEISPRVEEIPNEFSQSVAPIHRFAKVIADQNIKAFFENEPKFFDQIIKLCTLQVSTLDVRVLIFEIELELVRQIDVLKENQILLIIQSINIYLNNFTSPDLKTINLITSIVEELKISISTLEALVVTNLLDNLYSILRKSKHLVNLETKQLLICIIAKLVQKDWLNLEKFIQLTKYLSSVLNYESRLALCSIVRFYAHQNNIDSALIINFEKINSFVESKGRLEPDTETRIAGFADFSKNLSQDCSPVIYNCFINTSFHVLNYSNSNTLQALASLCLKNFIERYNAQDDSLWDELINSVFITGLKKGFEIKKDTVNKEYCLILSKLATIEKVNPLSEMAKLSDSDSEQDFYENLYHIQSHRRIQALNKLYKYLYDNEISTRIFSQFLLLILKPICESSNGNIAAIARKAFAATFCYVPWIVYQKHFKRILNTLSNSDKAVTKRNLQTLSEIILLLEGSFQKITNSKLKLKLKDVPDLQTFQSKLKNLLIPLIKLCSEKSEETPSIVILASTLAIRLSLLLDVYDRTIEFNKAFTILVGFLRSRSEDVRREVRKQLAKLSSTLIPQYTNITLQILREQLCHGVQRHILGFTVHHMLTETISNISSENTDSFIISSVDILVDDIFGQVGQEKEAQEYNSGAVETKGCKSFDSWEMLSRKMSSKSLPIMLKALINVLHDSSDRRQMKKMKELLLRFSTGLRKNRIIKTGSKLEFCVFLDTEIEIEKNKSQEENTIDEHFIVKVANDPRDCRTYFAKNSHLLQAFLIDLSYQVLKKKGVDSEYDIGSFAKVYQKYLTSKEEILQSTSLKALNFLVSKEVYITAEQIEAIVDQVFTYVKDTNDLGSELAQNSLKFLTYFIRERNYKYLSKEMYDYLLVRIRSDMEEYHRQKALFALIKSILMRKIVSSELYKTMDIIAKMLIRNQEEFVRETCRDLYIRFLLDYPHSRSKLKETVVYFCRNFEYEYADGRKSAMEMVFKILKSFHVSILDEVIGFIAVSSCTILGNDQNEECRLLAGNLVSFLVAQANSTTLELILSMIKLWTSQAERSALVRTGLLSLGIFMSEKGLSETLANQIFLKLMVQINVDEPFSVEIVEKTWEVLYYGLICFEKAVIKDPVSSMTGEFSCMWKLIYKTLNFPHSWIKVVSSRLLYKELKQVKPPFGGIEVLRVSDSISLSAKVGFELFLALMKHLETQYLTEELVEQDHQNLTFLFFWLSSLKGNDELSPVKFFFPKFVKAMKSERSAALKIKNLKRKAYMKLFDHFLHVLELEQLDLFIVEIIMCFNRFETMVEVEKSRQHEIVTLAQVCNEKVRSKIGADHYVKYYTRAKAEIEKIRQERKNRRQQEAKSIKS